MGESGGVPSLAGIESDAITTLGVGEIGDGDDDDDERDLGTSPEADRMPP